ncbi:tetratricopeptide repeat protein [Aggregicoccus sp. 17bor-14]|uniref:tetratricopeptide repeat protein n=1 Tax=Myxococcaceae TaxID=31 RepID=UPI00129CE367|nr:MULTISPECIES: tetratricopeptide repeat protein [Myxococcaceae]MBF5044028.1 tetratricopeptide repeat protein [Simulacricoccus sp. 17bor-14]MRI89779.1 tetratricopeptide repeat protein [Aggregicoccus sp. 17bor-14]
MKAVLRFGALAVGVALAAGGVGEAEAQQRRAKKPAAAAAKESAAKETASKPAKAKAPKAPAVPEAPERQGPARMVSNTKFGEIPRIEDAKRGALADRKRDEAIEGLKRLVAKLEPGSPARAAMIYHLSELYLEKSKYLYSLEMAKQKEAEKAYDAAVARGDKGEAPQADHRGSERYRAETMKLYEQLLTEFPDYERRDEVLFAVGYNLEELNRRDESVKRYQTLIQEFPQSEFTPHAYIQLGNYYFDKNKLTEARENFLKARESKTPMIYAYAVYKLAWCDYNSGELEAGLKKLYEVVDYADSPEHNLANLRTEALNDLTVFYVQMNRPDEALSYFRQKAPEKKRNRLLAKTAGGLADEGGHFDSAIKIYRVLIQESPMGPDAPEFQQAIVKAHEGLRQRAQVRTEMKKMVDLYRPGGEWWKANEGQAPVLRNAFSVTEEAMRTMVTEYHQEAQKTRQVETYRLARDIYKQYVDAFASSENPEYVADSAFNLRFFYAEILWALEEWDHAAEAYDQVVAFKIPDRESAKEASNESYREKAAYAAVLAYDKLVKIERGELAKSNLKDGEKVNERKDKGDMEKQGRLVKRDAKQVEEQPLSKFEQKLVAACDTYNRLYPNNKDEIDLRYQAAVILYDRNHFVDAARRFGEIIEKFPEEKRSQDAADLTMYVLETRQEWGELNALSRKFLANKKLTRNNPDFAKRVASVVEGSQYKWVHEVVYLKEKNPAKAADEFLKFVAEFPKSENADRALTSAMVIFQEANQLDRGVSAGEQLLRDHPKSPYALQARYTLAQFYEKTAEFKKSAAMYEAFVAAYDAAVKEQAESKQKGKDAKPAADDALAQKKAEQAQVRKSELAKAEKWVADAVFNAGLWWEGVGESGKAISAYNTYLSRFKDRKDVPEIAYNIALVHEKDKKWGEAARAFERFAETYAHDPRTTPGKVYVAKYRQMLALRQGRNLPDAERVQGELVRGWARLSADARKDVSVLDAYAHARFLAVEPEWKTFTDIKLNRVATLKRDLLAKQREMQRLEKAYIDVLNTGAGEWAIASLTRIGLAYADFARNIVESPDPKGLDEEQTELYRTELENLSMPLEEKAQEALDKGLSKAYELALYDEWTLAAQEQMNKYQPGRYARVREVPYRGSEFFATAGVEKQPDEAATGSAKAEPVPAAAPAAAPVPPKPTDGSSTPSAAQQPAPTALLEEAR